MNVINIHLDFPRKRESCVDCGGQVWNVRKELSYFGKETCVDCGAISGTCPHWLHFYTYLEPLTLMPLSHEIQRTSLRFQLERNASLEIHSDLLPPWPETPLSPSTTLRSKFGYRCQFAPVWSSTRASHPLMYSRLEGKITPSQIVTQIHQVQTTPSVSNLQLPEICQQQQYPHQQLQQEQRHEQQQSQQQKHKQQKQQSLQNKLQQNPTKKPTTASPKASPETKTPDAAITEAKSLPATTSTVPASTRSIHSQTQSAATTSTATKGKASPSSTAAISTVSTGKAAATTGPTAAAAVPIVVSSSIQQQTYCATSATTTKGKTFRAQTSAFSLAPPSSTFVTTSSISKPPTKVKTTAPESNSAVPAQQPIVETPKPQPAAAALPAGAETASTTSSKGTSGDQQQSQQSQPTQPKQPEQRLSPVTQALDNYLQGINGIPSIDQSDLKEPPQGKVVLGQGAYGGVLMMLYNNQPVAVKCVPTGNKDTVEREVRILSLLSQHDCFPNLHGIIEVGQFRAVAMQFIGDEASATCLTLGDALNGSRSLTLDPAEWRSIAMNVVDGIQHMHAEGLLHNDIKMDNILMSYDTQKHLWRAYVIDVGVATTTIVPRNYVLTSEEKERYRKFHAHIAPEMVDKGEPQSTQSDIFQLGYVLHSIGKFGAVNFLEQLGDSCKSRDPAQRPDITHVRYCIQNNTFI